MRDREYLQLRIRNIIVDKEWATAYANMETARAGEWTCDWFENVREAEETLGKLFLELEALK